VAAQPEYDNTRYFTEGVVAIATVKTKMSVKEAKRWMGQPVCIILQDRSYIVGCITEVKGGQLIIHGKKSHRKMNSSVIKNSEKAQISGLFSSLLKNDGGIGGILDGMFGGKFPYSALMGGNAQQGAGGGDMMSSLGKMWPGFKMGLGMMKSIMPLFGGLL